MCGRLACTLCPDDIIKSCTYYENKKDGEEPKWLSSQYEYKAVYNGPPTTVVPVMSYKQNFPDVEDLPEYCLIPMRWGLLPPYKMETTGNFHTHNARLENIYNSPLYKPCLTSGKRCAILADGYYEWQTTQGENMKQPYFIYQKPEEDSTAPKYLMHLAGLFNTIRDEMGTKYTCTILTTESDSSMSWMHHRMPIILNTQEEIHNWLNYDDVKYDEALKNLPKYCNADKKYQLKYHAVDKAYVNKSTCNERKCMERMSIKRKSSTLDSWLKGGKK